MSASQDTGTPVIAAQSAAIVSAAASLEGSLPMTRRYRNLFYLVADLCNEARKVERAGGEYATFDVTEHMIKLRDLMFSVSA